MILYGTKENPQKQSQSVKENSDFQKMSSNKSTNQKSSQKDQNDQRSHKKSPSTSYTQPIGQTKNDQTFIDWKNLQDISSYYSNHYKQSQTNAPVVSTIKKVVPDNSYYFIASNQKNNKINNHDQYFTDIYTADDYQEVSDDEYNLDYDQDYDAHNVIKTDGIRIQEPISLQSISKPSAKKKQQPDESSIKVNSLQGTQEQRASYDYKSASSSSFFTCQFFHLKIIFSFIINLFCLTIF